jgi:hypothetical protein
VYDDVAMRSGFAVRKKEGKQKNRQAILRKIMSK